MIVWGGCDATCFQTGGRFTPSTDMWTPMSSGANVPDARRHHTAVWTGTEMIVWGGDTSTASGSPNDPRNTGGRYCACINGLLVYQDADGDGFGNPGVSIPSCNGGIAVGYVADHTDCNDANAATRPGATEVCNGIDDNCDGVIDNGGAALCSDNNSCSVNDRCSGGVCSGTCYCTESGGGVAGSWPGEGNAIDISGGGHNGTLTNGATFGSGNVGQAFSLDGVNDLVQVPGYLNSAPVSEVTAVFWQKVSSVKVQSTFSASGFVNGSVFNAHVPYSDGKVYWDFGNINTGGRLSYTPSVSLVGTWQHFALVASQSGNYMRIFRNGVMEAEKSGMTPFVRANLDLAIGGAASLGISFGGQIDEFAIYNRALSASEIRAQYDAGAQGVCKQCTDPDGDGYGAAGDTCHNGTTVDCAATNASVWAVPGNLTGVTFTKVASPGTVRWAWSPATGGAAGSAFYDVWQSGGGQPSTCVLSNGVATEVTESAIPAVGTLLSYTGRAENACGAGPGSQPDCP